VNPTPAGTVTPEVLTGFSGTTGLGVLTTGDTAGAGVASVVCGATITTVAGTDPYLTNTYDGAVRVAVTY
jgi:hypothetical protein